MREYLALRAGVDDPTLLDQFLVWLYRTPGAFAVYEDGDDPTRATLVDWFVQRHCEREPSTRAPKIARAARFPLDAEYVDPYFETIFDIEHHVVVHRCRTCGATYEGPARPNAGIFPHQSSCPRVSIG